MSWCWWCCHAFDGEPLQMPRRHDPLRNKFTTQGHFCSWSCMKAFAVDKFGVNAGSVICGNIITYRKQKYNKIGSVPMAPNRFRLIEFGGDMTIEEFRANSLRDEGVSKHVETSAHVERLIPFTSAIEEASMAMAGAKKRGNDDPAPGLKLKRTKPLKKTHASLEDALGLVIKPKQLSHEKPL